MSDWLKSFRGSQRSQGALNGITEAINESDDTSSFDPQETQSPLKRHKKSENTAVTPIRSELFSPTTPRSDFHNFANHDLSPFDLSTPVVSSFSAALPTSRDWSPLTGLNQFDSKLDCFGFFENSPGAGFKSSKTISKYNVHGIASRGRHITNSDVLDCPESPGLVTMANAVESVTSGHPGSHSASGNGRKKPRKQTPGISRDIGGFGWMSGKLQSSPYSPVHVRDDDNDDNEIENLDDVSSSSNKKQDINIKSSSLRKKQNSSPLLENNTTRKKGKEKGNKIIKSLKRTVDDATATNSSTGTTGGDDEDTKGVEVTREGTKRKSSQNNSNNNSNSKFYGHDYVVQTLSNSFPNDEDIKSPPQIQISDSTQLLPPGISPLLDTTKHIHQQLNNTTTIENKLDTSQVPSTASITTSISTPLVCNCKKTKCLKLYCDCFRLQKYCEGCGCSKDCANKVSHESERIQAIASITERNPEAFKPRITDHAPTRNGENISNHIMVQKYPSNASNVSSMVTNFPVSVVSGTPAVSSINSVAANVTANAQHVSGCHCKKSACLKKYCECFQASVQCHDKCRCVDCKNVSQSSRVTSFSTSNLIERSPYHMMNLRDKVAPEDSYHINSSEYISSRGSIAYDYVISNDSNNILKGHIDNTKTYYLQNNLTVNLNPVQTSILPSPGTSSVATSSHFSSPDVGSLLCSLPERLLSSHTSFASNISMNHHGTFENYSRVNTNNEREFGETSSCSNTPSSAERRYPSPSSTFLSSDRQNSLGAVEAVSLAREAFREKMMIPLNEVDAKQAAIEIVTALLNGNMTLSEFQQFYSSR